MKKIILLVLLLCGAITTNAQKPTSRHDQSTLSNEKKAPLRLPAEALEALSVTSTINKYIVKEAYAWDMDSIGGKLDYSQHIKYYYDKNGNEVSYLNQVYSPSTQIWENYQKDTFYYDIAGRDTGNLAQRWDGSGNAWIDFHRQTYPYDAAKRLETFTVQDYDFTTGEWITKFKALAYRSGTGLDSILISQQYFNGTVFFQAVDTIHRGPGGRPKYITNSSWNKSTQAYELRTMTTYKYDSKGRELVYNGYQWDAGKMKFTQQYVHDTSSYNGATGDLLEEVTSYPDSNGVLQKNYRYIFSYDLNHNRLTNITEIWGTTSWLYSTKIIAKYDANNSQVQRDEYNYKFNGYYDYGLTWQNTFQGISGIEEAGNKNALLVFPNPANDYINLYSPTVQRGKSQLSIINTLGQTMYSETCYDKQTKLNCNSWPVGIYICTLKTPEGIITRKVIKQ
jgi:hypothetical protein